MNFFQHQQRARQRTGWLVLLFLAASAITVALANGVMLVSVALLVPDTHAPFSLSQWILANPASVAWTTFGTVSFIGGASLYRMMKLGRGGGGVACEAGGVLVDGNVDDPRKRQLVNVVEEMALAAGVPVPQVYVLEQEPGINAFAAGFTTSDAAIAVTRGALDTFTRDELQGVIAHEFSHILNGDMRLNTRLLGVLFGLLVIGLSGRAILRAARHSRRGGGRLALAGLGLVIVGYIGLLFGNMIRAAVSRQRELLADAAAVQFTRNPLGIAGALKKIAISPGRPVLQMVDAEELGHMLIADGRKTFTSLFATHPPILSRIKAIDRHFQPSELERIAQTPVIVEKAAVSAAPASSETLAKLLSPAMVIAAIGSPSDTHIDAAMRRQAGIPDSLKRAARSGAHAPALVIALALHKDAGERGRQIERLRKRLPQTLVPHLEAMVTMTAPLAPEHRLPLIEMAFPALRQRSVQELRDLIAAVDELTRMDGRVDVLDYALVRLLRVHLSDAANPRAVVTGSAKLHALRDEAGLLFSLLAHAGGGDKPLAHAAYERGMRALLGNNTPAYGFPSPWVAPVDRALARLDGLAPMAKQVLIEAMVVTVFHDKRVTLGEAELLRAVCASLHCPVPPLMTNESATSQDSSGAPHVAA